jgi:hypothetical protein
MPGGLIVLTRELWWRRVALFDGFGGLCAVACDLGAGWGWQ